MPTTQVSDITSYNHHRNENYNHNESYNHKNESYNHHKNATTTILRVYPIVPTASLL